MNRTLLQVKEIRTDGGTQPRAAVDFKLVADYAEAMSEGAEFPPVTVFYDGSSYWLADGFHRLFATKKAGVAEIAADVVQGTQREAVLHSFGVNETHGFRRSADDKRRAVIRMLKDEEWGKWPQGQIAKVAGVSREYVSRVWQSVKDTVTYNRSQVEGADGRTINTAKIGKGKADLSEYTRERYAKTYSPPPLPEADESEEVEPEIIYDEPSAEEDEPYIPPYVSNPDRPDFELKKLSNEPKPKEPPFVEWYVLLGKVQSKGHRSLIEALNSIENRTQEQALEARIADVIEMLRASLKQAEIERKTVTA
jgi:hypothetical protein